MTCKKGGYCSLKLVSESKTAAVEICTKCGAKRVYRKAEKGRVDSKKYAEDHKADFAQPFGRTGKLFEKTYGTKGLRDLKKQISKIKTKEQHQREFDELFHEAQRDLKRKVI